MEYFNRKVITYTFQIINVSQYVKDVRIVLEYSKIVDSFRKKISYDTKWMDAQDIQIIKIHTECSDESVCISTYLSSNDNYVYRHYFLIELDPDNSTNMIDITDGEKMAIVKINDECRSEINFKKRYNFKTLLSCYGL